MFGFYGRIITIDLSIREYRIESLADDVLAAQFGGKGLATRLLLERNPVGVDPLGEDNHIIFATGPFCRNRIWGGSRYGVFTKSPLTGFYSESYSGGRVPEAIDATGFDAVIFKGKAVRPTVVSLDPQGASFHDAGDLWGADTFQSEAQALQRFGDLQGSYDKPGAVVIGPAGEQLVRYAIIANDKWRCAGRTGVGAVMGSKLLKAVVFQGDRRRELFDPEAVADYAKAFSKANMKNPGVKAYRAMGTTMMVALMNTVGAFPAKYWSQGSCAHWEQISGETFHKEHEVKPQACAKCFMACGRLARISKGRHKGLQIEGPEYETIYAFGGLCMVADMGEIAYLNDLCDRLGMDTITAGNLCALAIEAKLRGKIDDDIEYGAADKIGALIERIARQEGSGDILAEGIVPTAQKWGMESLAVHVKGLEPAGYDPRVLKGMGLTFATSPRGACHLRTTFYKPELAGLIPPDQIEDKAELLTDYEDRLNIFDTLILCRFYRDLYAWEELEKLIRMVTGMAVTKAELRDKAAAIATMTRNFNLREGLKPEDDLLPARLHKEKLPSGHALTSEEMAYLLKDYYLQRGWDENGVPRF
ncbi:MAG: aldehyde ferredoxin oxidoreductase family protein [Desulfobacteraceae bacterium]|jgi:aldehyde:ferredoxin oxidoreductase